MKQTVEIGTHKIELQSIKFIKSMGVKRIFQSTLIDLFKTEDEDIKLTTAELRDRFYNLDEKVIQDIFDSLALYIVKIDRKTKITEDLLDELLSNLDVTDIIMLMQVIFNGLVGDEDKKK